MVIAQEPAQSVATLNGPRAMNVRIPREQQDVALPFVIALSVKMFDVFAQGPPQGALTEETTLHRHSSFTDLTQRSA